MKSLYGRIRNLRDSDGAHALCAAALIVAVLSSFAFAIWLLTLLRLAVV